ncbi:MAG: hypothetical protein OCC49_15875 [Fibrobacterales bacterium]
MKWLKLHLINIPIVDMQHKILFYVVETLRESLKKGTTNSESVRSLTFLMGYITHHFYTEERVMQSLGYPQEEEHSEHHGRLLKLLDTKIALVREKIEVNTQELLDMLIDVVNVHLIQDDLKIREWVEREEGVLSENAMMRVPAFGFFISIFNTSTEIMEGASGENLEENKENLLVNLHRSLDGLRMTSLSEIYDIKMLLQFLQEHQWITEVDITQLISAYITEALVLKCTELHTDPAYAVLILDVLKKEEAINEQIYTSAIAHTTEVPE